MKRTFSIMACVILITVATFLLYFSKRGVEPVSVEITQAKQKDVYNSIVANGTVENDGVYHVIFSEDSMIQQVYVTEGQKIKKDEPILLRAATGVYPNVLTKGITGVTAQIVSAFSEYGIHLSIDLPTVSSEETVVRSPANGVVSELNVSPNQEISGFELAAKVLDFESMKVSVDLSEIYLSSISLGQEVRITGDAFPQKEYIGFVTKIASSATKKNGLLGKDETYVPVEISLKNADADLKPGYSVTSRIHTEKRKNAIIIPYDCILQDESGRELVYVVEGDIAYKKRIITGLELENESEVLYGLSEGETLVRFPKETLKSGQVVVVKK